MLNAFEAIASTYLLPIAFLEGEIEAGRNADHSLFLDGRSGLFLVRLVVGVLGVKTGLGVFGGLAPSSVALLAGSLVLAARGRVALLTIGVLGGDSGLGGHLSN